MMDIVNVLIIFAAPYIAGLVASVKPIITVIFQKIIVEWFMKKLKKKEAKKFEIIDVPKYEEFTKQTLEYCCQKECNGYTNMTIKVNTEKRQTKKW